MKKKILLILLSISFFANAQSPYEKRTNFNIAVFLIDYQDIPSAERALWPTDLDWERTLFHDKIQNYFKTISNDAFTVTGKVIDYQTSNLVYWDSANPNTLATPQQVISSINFTSPGFVYEDYDIVVFLQSHDARLGSSNLGVYNFNINGTAYTNERALYLSYQNGYWNRDSSNYGLSNTLVRKKSYLVPLSAGGTEENLVWFDLSQSESTYCHEIIHALGIQAHANSRTNGASYDYEPEIAGNGSYLNNEYGNLFDIMGSHSYSPSLNGSFRNFIGLLPQNEIVTVDEIGTQTITINPINSENSNRYLEILLPFNNEGFGYKNAGYGIEVRKVDALDAFLAHAEMTENTEGVFVHKINGLSNLLLDMSPSANISFGWGDYYDIRDVVLKPGMTYENDEVKLSNVIKNNDGSFTLDVEIKNTKSPTPQPTAISAVKTGTFNQVEVSWQNNHLTSGNSANITVELRNVTTGANFQVASTTVPNTATSYTSGFRTTAGDVYEARVFVQENTSNLQSNYSNLIATGCNVAIDHTVAYPVSCNGMNDGKIEVIAKNGQAPYQYKIDGGTYQSSNLLENLSKGSYTVWVKDSNGCEKSTTSRMIIEPIELAISTNLVATDLTIYANYGTGNYQYQLNNGSWQDSNEFSNVVGDYLVKVRDRNGCEKEFGTGALGIEDFVDNKLTIYPNPTSDIINVNGVTTIVDYKIYNLIGQELKNGSISNQYNKIDIKNIPNGLYFIRLKNKRTIKFIKE